MAASPTPASKAKRKPPLLKLRVRLSLIVLAYVLSVNCAVRRYGGDAFPLSVLRLPEKTYALVSLAAHSITHVWSSRCESPAGYVSEAALAEGIPVPFAMSIAKAESGFRSHSISSTGAMGVMQLMPKTARSVGVIDPFDPQDNARGAARHLRELWSHYRGDRLRIAAAYNAGSGRVPRQGGMNVPSSTRGYAARVVKRAREPRPTRPVVVLDDVADPVLAIAP